MKSICKSINFIGKTVYYYSYLYIIKTIKTLEGD